MTDALTDSDRLPELPNELLVNLYQSQMGEMGRLSFVLFSSMENLKFPDDAARDAHQVMLEKALGVERQANIVKTYAHEVLRRLALVPKNENKQESATP